MDRQKEFVLRTLEERDIRFVRLWFTDGLGYLKSVAIPPAELQHGVEEGIGFDGSSSKALKLPCAISWRTPRKPRASSSGV